MANLSFTSSGALPASSLANASRLGINGSTVFSDPNEAARKSLGLSPAANALSVAQKPSYTPPPPVQTPTTPVKSVTVNNPDGSSHTVAYHAPETATTETKPTQTPIPDTTSSTTDTPVFSGVVGSLADTSRTGSATAPGYIASTADYGAGNIPIGKNADAITGKYTGLINSVLKGTIGQEIGDRTTGTTPVGEGNAQLAATAGGSLIQGLTNQEGQELAGNAQGLTAQNQAATASNEAAGQAQTGQQLEQSGLAGAGTLAKPEASFPFVFNPATGSFSTPGTGGASGGPSLTYNPQKDAQTLAQAVMSKQIGYSDAISALSYGSNGSNAAGQLSSAIIAAGGNPTNLQAEATGEANILGSIPSMQSASTAAEGIGNQISSFLNQNPNINPSDLALGNQFKQWIQGKQLTDPKYQTLFNYLNEYTNTLAPVLGVGGDPTNLKTEIASSFINPKAGAASISEVIGNMNDLAKTKIQNLQAGAKGQGVTNPSSSSSTGSVIKTPYGTIDPSL